MDLKILGNSCEQVIIPESSAEIAAMKEAVRLYTPDKKQPITSFKLNRILKFAEPIYEASERGGEGYNKANTTGVVIPPNETVFLTNAIHRASQSVNLGFATSSHQDVLFEMDTQLADTNAM